VNILYLSEHYPPNIAGTTRYVEEICENMAKLGQNVFLITYTQNKDFFIPGEWVKKNNYFVYNIGLPNNIASNTRVARYYFCNEVKKIICQQIIETKANVVHVLYGHYLASIFNKLFLNIPTFWTIHNIPPAEYSRISLTRLPFLNNGLTILYFFIVRLINNVRFNRYKFTKYICISEIVKKTLLQKKLSPNNICVIPHGVDGDVFKPKFIDSKKDISNKMITILTVATVSEHKGLHVLLTATKKIIRNYPNIRFINIGSKGEKNYKQKIDRYIKKNRLGFNWHFITSPIDTEELVRNYNNCDIYVQPSLEEGFCLTFLEATACGKTIIGTCTGAMPEILKLTKSETPCPTGDSDCLADKIIKILQTRKDLTLNTENQHQIVCEEYSWHTTALKMLNLYQEEIQKLY